LTSAAAVLVQKLPFIPPTDPGLHFDKYQFHKRSRAVTATNGISFQDYGGMHVVSRELNSNRARYIPAFANNDEQLRLVLCQSAWQYIKGGGKCRTRRVPDNFVRHPRLLEKLCDARIAVNARREVKTGRGTRQDWIHRVHVIQMHEHGGYMHMQARVAYMSFRLGMQSIEIAPELGITPPHARQLVQRLCDTARWLGLETFPRHKTYGTHRKKKMPRRDITGQKFGRLTVVAFNRYRGPYDFWFCKCDCGRGRGHMTGSRRRHYLGKSLRYGDTRSCGCLHKEVVRSGCRKTQNTAPVV
jgi:hypothetical protein